MPTAASPITTGAPDTHTLLFVEGAPRWFLPGDTASARTAAPEPLRLIAHGGLSLLLLDTRLPTGAGHLGVARREAIEAALRPLGDRPLVVALGHPLGRAATPSERLDDEAALWSALAGANLRLLLWPGATPSGKLGGALSRPVAPGERLTVTLGATLRLSTGEEAPRRRPAAPRIVARAQVTQAGKEIALAVTVERGRLPDTTTAALRGPESAATQPLEAKPAGWAGRYPLPAPPGTPPALGVWPLTVFVETPTGDWQTTLSVALRSPQWIEPLWVASDDRRPAGRPPEEALWWGVADPDRGLLARTLAEGTLRARGSGAGRLLARPCLADAGPIFLAGEDGTVVAQDRDAQALWTARTDARFTRTDVLARSGEVLGALADDGRVLALSVPSGRLLWAAAGTGAALVAGAGVLACAEADGLLRVFEAATGRVLWQRRLATRGNPALLILPDRVLASEDDGVSAFRLDGGAPLWRRPGLELSAPILAASGTDRVVAAGGSLAALRPTDGAVLWRAAVGAPLRTVSTSAWGLVFALRTDGVLSAYQDADGVPGRRPGALLWSARLGGGWPLHPPSVHGDRVVVATTLGEVFAFPLLPPALKTPR